MTKMVQDLMVAVERVADDFHQAVFVAADLDAALATLDAGCVLVNLPSGSGADGPGLRRFLAEDVLPHLPADLSFRRLSRTADRWRVADETLVQFTHDRELPWLLPGLAPTHRRAEVLAVSVVTVRRATITSHRTLWDQSGLLARLRLDGDDAGDSACWLGRVCDVCGALDDGPPQETCPRCGTATGVGPPR